MGARECRHLEEWFIAPIIRATLLSIARQVWFCARGGL